MEKYVNIFLDKKREENKNFLMIVNKIDPKTKEVVKCLIDDKGFNKLGLITFSPVKDNKQKLAIFQEDDRKLPIEINKDELEVVCNREGELAVLQKWLKNAVQQSKDLQKCYRECELLYHNFLMEIKVRVETEEEKKEGLEKVVKEKEEERKKMEERKKLVKFYD